MVAKVEKVGGRIVKRENWGSRPMAYSIANRKRGNYMLLVTDGSADAIKTLEHAISLEERIIRSLTTKLTELSDKASPLLRRVQAAAKREEDAAAAAVVAAEEAAAAEAAAPAEEATAAPAEEAAAAPATEEAAPAAKADGADASV